MDKNMNPTPTPWREWNVMAERGEDEYPTAHLGDIRLVGANDLCVGVLFGGHASLPECDCNAAFIVDAVNNHELLKQKLEFAEFEWNRATAGMQERDAENATLTARVEELERIARQSRDAMLATRTASIAGCHEGYGKPEKWADDLFQSHAGLTKAIKAIDAALTSTEPRE